jgi:glycosyltransferase involved in cell wall biosynthesis
MTIAFIYDCAYPYVKGGVERRIFEITKRLSTKHQVRMITMKWWKGERRLRLNGNILLHGVCPKTELYSSPGRRKSLPALLFSFSLIPTFFKVNPHILDCQNIPYLPAFICKLFCAIRHKPLIITWHEVWGDYWHQYLGWRGIFGKLIEKLASRLTNHNIANSPHTLKRFKEISHMPITLIPPGVDLEKIRETKPSPEQFDLLFVGRLIPEKNVNALIRTIVSIEMKVTCAIIGDGPERERLERLADELKLLGRIKFLGFIPDVYPYMKSSKIFVFPSMREGFGMVVIEANACGLPTILLDHPHNAAVELIEEGRNGFVCRDEDEMRDRIVQLLSDRRMWERMRRDALRMAKRYSWDRIVWEYERFIEGCLEAERGYPSDLDGFVDPTAFKEDRDI